MDRKLKNQILERALNGSGIRDTVQALDDPSVPAVIGECKKRTMPRIRSLGGAGALESKPRCGVDIPQVGSVARDAIRRLSVTRRTRAVLWWSCGPELETTGAPLSVRCRIRYK